MYDNFTESKHIILYIASGECVKDLNLIALMLCNIRRHKLWPYSEIKNCGISIVKRPTLLYYKHEIQEVIKLNKYCET